MKELSVWIANMQVGTLSAKKGRLQFSYSRQWLENPDAQALSFNLPLREEPFNHEECRAYFMGLLPEGDFKKVIAKKLNIQKQGELALLGALAGDCLGAVCIAPQAPIKYITGKSKLTWLDDKALLGLFKSLPVLPKRATLPGEGKHIPVIYDNGRFALPEEGIASTHILKLASSDLSGELENEHFCLSLAEKCGIATVAHELITIGNTRVLLKSRFDRVVRKNSPTLPIPCEDFCQALGIVPENKYQKDGGPSFADCFAFLRANTRPFAANVSQLFDRVLLNLIIGNHLAHGKQFQIIYRDKRWQLAPLSSVISSVIYDNLPSKPAMKLGGKYRFASLLSEHLEKFVDATELSHAMCRKRASIFIQQITEQAEKLKQLHQELYGPSVTVDALLSVIQERAVLLKEIISKPLSTTAE